jgi:hypothetical protein
MTGIPRGWIPYWGLTPIEVVRNRRIYIVDITILFGLFFLGAGVWGVALVSGVQLGPSWESTLAFELLLADLIPFGCLWIILFSARRRMAARPAGGDHPN